MNVEMLQSKIHRAVVTEASLNYVGSITIDKKLLELAGICEYQKVQVVDVDNGSRFETYTIAGEEGSGIVCLNGAAARCSAVGDKIIIMSYVLCDINEASKHRPKVILVDEKNSPIRTANYEKHGKLEDF